MGVVTFYLIKLTASILDMHTVSLKVFISAGQDDKVLATLKFD